MGYGSFKTDNIMISDLVLVPESNEGIKMGVNYNPYSLTGKTVLITGASSGIGRKTAIECSKLGAQVVLTGRNRDRLNETFTTLLRLAIILFRLI